MKILAADHVLPITAKPIESAGVTIDGASIIAVGTLAEMLDQFPDAAVENFGDAVILPGFVNCHAHLEITAMRSALDAFESDFAAWLITLTKLRGEVMSHNDLEIAALAGALEAARGGVTCLADIGRFGLAGLNALKATGLRGVLYQETEFSPAGSTADVDLERLKAKYLELSSKGTGLVGVGISPHAPYTVSRELFESIARFAANERVSITIHAAESSEEDQLMRHGRGLFLTVYERFGVRWTSPLCSSIEFLSQTGILETRPLLAHCITVDERDIELISESGSSVAHCPKSNAKFGHGNAPLEKFFDAGVAVGFGSDSVASNNVCDILEEARFAALIARNRIDRNRLLSGDDVLSTATLGGARALGLDDRVGSLEPGKQADLAVVSLQNIAQRPVTDAVASLVFSSNARDVQMTMVAGREVYRGGKSTLIDEAEIAARLNEIGKKIRSFTKKGSESVPAAEIG
jgi:cytosine/adenosine deaminase-related metal-dependent hydrolase